MDINFIQETIDSLRTLTQQNGALTRQNSQLINEIAKESTINTKAEEIKQAVENIDLSSLENKIDNIKLPEIDISTFVNTITSRSVKYDKQSGNLTIENVELTIE